MKGEMCISHLPEEIVQHIASFLSPRDLTRLSMTCHQMNLPIFIHKHGYGYDKPGSYGFRRLFLMPDFYFKSPTFTSRPKEVTISMKWNTQGTWKYPKGKIWIQLMRPLERPEDGKLYFDANTCSWWFNKSLSVNSIMISEDSDIFDLPPHGEEGVAKVLTRQDYLLRKARPGDYIQIKTFGGEGNCRLLPEYEVLIELFPHESN